MEEVNVNDDVKALQQKVDLFFKQGRAVHLKFKKGYWKNGHIIENSSADFFMLNEFVEGERPVFYLELDDVSEFKEVKKNG